MSGAGEAAAPRPPKKRKSALRAIVLLAAALAGTAALIFFGTDMFGDRDERLIAFERLQRRWRWDNGLAMPGEPDLANLNGRLAESGLSQGDPILIRIFKREFELELWMKREGAYKRFATYPICRWSGTLGPKLVQGDAQAPEGFYAVDAGALNPESRYHRSFNLGYPNAFDRANNRTGSLIMVHGGCASIGCFAMTNAQIDEIWSLVTSALNGGQKRFQVQVYPFRMSDENLARYANHPNQQFWRDLKRGNDLFLSSLLAPKAFACAGRYRFEAGAGSEDAAIEARCPAATPKG